jgi:antitoxin VapB
MIVREERGEFRFEPADKPKAKIDVSGFWGKAPWLKVPERRDFEERQLDWEGKKLKPDE